MTKSHRTRLLAKLPHLLKTCCQMGRNVINKPFNQCSDGQWPTRRHCDSSSEAPLTSWLLCFIITNFQKPVRGWNWKEINIPQTAIFFLPSHHTGVLSVQPISQALHCTLGAIPPSRFLPSTKLPTQLWFMELHLPTYFFSSQDNAAVWFKTT